MCCANKCYGVVDLKLVFVIVGIVLFVLSSLVATSSLIFVLANDYHEALEVAPSVGNQLLMYIRIDGLTKLSMKLKYVIIFIVALMWIASTSTLLIGVLKNDLILVICYFTYGIFLVFYAMINALLIFIKGSWELSILIWIAIIIYICCLAVVNSFYEQQMRNKYGIGGEVYKDDEKLITA